MIKISTNERYDCILIKQNKFIHHDYLVSPQSELFSIENGMMFRSGISVSESFGINKKNYKISKLGMRVDGSNIGQAE